MIRTIVVDDEPYLRKSIKVSIENTNSNYTVIAEAGNGVQAYDLIIALEPDVVFLDIRMPIMDGIALLEKLHNEKIKPICVILSGYSEFEYAKKAIHFGVFDYILKPIHMDQLEELLNDITDRLNTNPNREKKVNLNYAPINEIANDIADMIKDYINQNYSSQLTLKEIANNFHISPSYLSNIFKKAFNETPNEYIMKKRIQKSKELLAVYPPMSIKQIAIITGYTDPFYFSRIFKIESGMTPTEYRDSLKTFRQN